MKMDRSIFVDTLRTHNLSKTPGMQRIRQYFSIEPTGNQEQYEGEEPGNIAESLEVLLKQTWNIWGVSSLYGFQKDSEVHLKLYGKKMREEIAAIIPHEDFTYDVKFTIVETMENRPSASDPEPIKIEVLATQTSKEVHNNSRNVPEKQKSIYNGILLSWRTVVNELDFDKCIKLPLLLCRGTKSAMRAVHITLGNMFDCHVVALPATEDDLKWLVPIVLQPAQKEEPQKGETRLEYRVPGLSVTNRIAVKFNARDLARMWSAIIQNDENNADGNINFKAAHIERFHEVLNKQIIQSAGLQLGLCTLHKISLPAFTIMENKMKASSPDVMSRVLLFFNEKALEILHLLNFDTTHSTNNMTSQVN